MKILLASDSPFVSTAYALQSAILAEELTALGHEIFYYGLTLVSKPIKYAGMILVGSLGANEGKFLLDHYAEFFDVDIILTIKDPFVFPVHIMRQLKKPWVAFCPIDTHPISIALIEHLGPAMAVCTPTRTSKALLDQVKISSTYTPHCVDPIYSPGPSTFKKELGIAETAKLFSMIAANQTYPSRKNIDTAILAFDKWQKESNADAYLYLHTDISPLRGGIDLFTLLRFLGNQHIIVVDQNRYEMGIKNEYLLNCYRGSDFVLIPSEGEGFCLPAVEAQACGAPLIYTDFGSLAETAKAGIKIEKGHRTWVPLGSYRERVTEDAIAKALQEAYVSTHDYTSEAVEHAAQYEKRLVIHKHWIPFISSLEETLKGDL